MWYMYVYCLNGAIMISFLFDFIDENSDNHDGWSCMLKHELSLRNQGNTQVDFILVQIKITELFIT